MIIGLAGKFGSGKDTAAEVLVKHFGFRAMSFAEPLRRECEHAVATKQYPREMPDALYEELKSAIPSQVWEKPTSSPIRKLLQFWGTDYRRAQNPHYWVDAAKLMMQNTPLGVMTDVRFENEVDLVKQFGQQWLITRPQQITALHTHVSEQLVDTYTAWDRIIANDGTIADLHDRVFEAASSVLVSRAS